jgi:ATP-dependent Zn protease
MIKQQALILFTLGIIILSMFGCTSPTPLPQEKWQYKELIQEVKKGRIEKVSISADKTFAIVKVKQGSNPKLVLLINDPIFIFYKNIFRYVSLSYISLLSQFLNLGHNCLLLLKSLIPLAYLDSRTHIFLHGRVVRTYGFYLRALL